jgi:hypothetical protein
VFGVVELLLEVSVSLLHSWAGVVCGSSGVGDDSFNVDPCTSVVPTRWAWFRENVSLSSGGNALPVGSSWAGVV